MPIQQPSCGRCGDRMPTPPRDLWARTAAAIEQARFRDSRARTSPFRMTCVAASTLPRSRRGPRRRRRWRDAHSSWRPGADRRGGAVGHHGPDRRLRPRHPGSAPRRPDPDPVVRNIATWRASRDGTFTIKVRNVKPRSAPPPPAMPAAGTVEDRPVDLDSGSVDGLRRAGCRPADRRQRCNPASTNQRGSSRIECRCRRRHGADPDVKTVRTPAATPSPTPTSRHRRSRPPSPTLRATPTPTPRPSRRRQRRARADRDGVRHADETRAHRRRRRSRRPLPTEAVRSPRTWSSLASPPRIHLSGPGSPSAPVPPTVRRPRHLRLAGRRWQARASHDRPPLGVRVVDGRDHGREHGRRHPEGNGNSPTIDLRRRRSPRPRDVDQDRASADRPGVAAGGGSDSADRPSTGPAPCGPQTAPASRPIAAVSSSATGERRARRSALPVPSARRARRSQRASESPASPIDSGRRPPRDHDRRRPDGRLGRALGRDGNAPRGLDRGRPEEPGDRVAEPLSVDRSTGRST